MSAPCAIIHADTGDVVVRPFDETLIIGVETHEYRDHGGTPRKIIPHHPASSQTDGATVRGV